MAGQSARGKVVLSFGRFELSAGERLLTADGAPVELGARTLDTLIALVSRPNEVVSKRELMAEVWPDVTVEEGSLRFHIASLRKVLGDGNDGARYIATLPGRGYCFVAPVARLSDQADSNVAAGNSAPTASFLPARSMRMVGRSEDIRMLATRLQTSRIVTVVGPGGVGKTTLAVAVAHDLLDAFAGAVVFVDLGMLTDPKIVTPALASMLGLAVQSDDAIPSLSAYLRDKQMLLVLDSCEHVIDCAARLAASILMAAPRVHILATSRESLRVDGEWVYRLAPLALPPDDAGLTAAVALTFPATQLFVERVVANGVRPNYDDADAAIVASICRRLDGVALAIELAAGRVAAYGLEQTAALLGQSFALQWPGNRTAPPRQKSLKATLDWSYSLLSDLERVVLRRLAAFVGHFTLEAAQAVAASATIDRVSVLSAIESLVGKSLIATHPMRSNMRYRLLDTTRAYVLEIGTDDTEAAELATRHATYYQHWLERTTAVWLTSSGADQRVSQLADINNVRAALEWCFGEGGDARIGVSLAAAAVAIFFAFSLLTECQHWSQRAVLALDDTTRAGRQEMRLQAALGLSLMWIRGNSEATYVALDRSIAIAKAQRDTLTQIQLLAPLYVFHMRIGDFRTAERHAEHVAALAQTVEDTAARMLSRILLGYSRHFAGDLSGARRELAAALQQGLGEETPQEQRSLTIKDDAMAAPIVALASAAAPSALSRTLWLQGHPAEALHHLNQTLRHASSTEHPAMLVTALVYAISVLLWNGSLDDAAAEIARLSSLAETYSLESYVVLGLCFQGQLAVARGEMETGIELLRGCMDQLHTVRYELLTTAFNLSLAEAFAATGRCTPGIALIDETIQMVERNGDLCYMPELLRVKAGLLLGLPQQMEAEAESCLMASLELSRHQGARAWELRTSIDIAKRFAAQGRPQEARAVLQPIYEQFEEGSNTADLRTAKDLLKVWS